MASFAKRVLETDSNESNGMEPNTSKRSCLKYSPSGEHSPASSEPSTASTSSSEPSPASGEPLSATIEYSDKLIVDLTGDSDEDEQDVSIPPAPAVNIDPHYSCSDLNSTSQLLRHLRSKLFLVDHDYILCPYCIITDQGKREKPSATRVSTIIERYISKGDERYMELVKVMQKMDNILNIDSSQHESVQSLAAEVVDKRFESHLKDQTLLDFMRELKCVLLQITNKNDRENSYREVFSRFLTILSSRSGSAFINQEPSAECNTVSFPNWKMSTTISGKPNIVILKEEGGIKKTLALIECKKYRELKFMFDKTEIKDDSDLQKAIPKVRFCKTAKKSEKRDKIEKGEVIMERMYKDLDASICRGLKHDEKTYFGFFIGQLVGEVLAWFNTSDQIPVALPFEIARGKCMKYAIGQLGFKIIFVTVSINNSCMENPPHIRIGKRRGIGLDVFITRPLDLMKADDREKIRDVLFVMMASAWKPAVAVTSD